jgi:hypothetical protein
VNDLLLIAAIVLPCWYAWKRSVERGQVEINHVTTFSFGFLFYWITPLAVRLWAPRLDFPMAAIWSSLFRAKYAEPYALSCLALYLCFLVGDTLAVRGFQPRPGPNRPKVPRLALSMVTLAGSVLGVYLAWTMRANLFRFAQPGQTQVGVARGAVTACVVLLGIVALIFTVERPEISWHRRLGSVYFLPLIAGGGMMLAVGSRLYVASLLLMFVIYQTNLRRKFKLRAVVTIVLVLTFLFGAIGRWREGSSINGAFFNVLLEPMEGSLSLVYYLRHNGIAWLNPPTRLLGDFKNLVPTILMPNKIKLLKIRGVYRPLGGLHSFVSFNMNFGLIGTALFWFLLPVGLRDLKRRLSATLPAMIYIMCSGWLAFTFFRDPFYISLVKAIFQNSILIPGAIVLFGGLLRAACAPADENLRLAPSPQIGGL